jgi:hypothetical protein
MPWVFTSTWTFGGTWAFAMSVAVFTAVAASASVIPLTFTTTCTHRPVNFQDCARHDTTFTPAFTTAALIVLVSMVLIYAITPFEAQALDATFHRMATGMLIDGIAASEAIDSSGEILDIKGCDISTLDTEGVLNWEHRGEDSPGHSASDIVGKIVFAKKIFSEKDCDNDRQKLYWKKVELPFIYIVARLYDAAGHAAAKDMAAQIRDHHANGEPILVRFSIEGTTMRTSEDKKNLLESVARRVACTIKPCNRSCHSGILSDPQAPEGFDKAPAKIEKDFLDEVLKRGEHPHPNFTPLGGSREVECNPILEQSEFQKMEKDDESDFDAETERIHERRETPEARAPHDFKAAKWTHPNGHPRCRLCGDEERTDGKCPGADHDGLKKATTAGSYNVAPGNLSGGAALQVEDHGLRAKTRAALQKWDGDSDIRAHLKHEIPEASDAYIDRFADLVEKYKFKKSTSLLKGEAVQAQIRKYERLAIELRKAASALSQQNSADKLHHEMKQEGFPEPKAADPAPDHVVFQGRKVKPGLARIRQTNDSLYLLAHSPTHYIAIPTDVGAHWSPDDLIRLPRGKDGTHYEVLKHPEDLESNDVVDAREHGHPVFNRNPEQQALIHGIDFRVPGKLGERGVNCYKSHWRAGGNKKTVYVKEAPEDAFSEARCEALYHNLAHDFFGLGEHVPHVALLRHPRTGQEHAVIERVDGEHVNTYAPGDHRDTLIQHQNDGSIDKLAFMNMITGNGDRHEGNWLVGNDGKLKMIDHGYAFGSGLSLGNSPTYWREWDGNRNWKNEPPHPAAMEWINRLDPNKLKDMLTDHEVPEYMQGFMLERLNSLKQNAATWPGASRWELMNHVRDASRWKPTEAA